MDWLYHHKRSETFATQAHKLRHDNLQSAAQNLFRLAAMEEETALSMLDASKPRTLGILAVSTVALWYKGRHFEKASIVANAHLANNGITGLAREQLLDLVATLAREQGAVEEFDLTGSAPSPFAEFALDTILSLANAVVQTAERIAALNLNTAYATLEIYANNQKALAEMLETELGDLQKAILGLRQHDTRSAPAGVDVTVAALQSTIASANSAFGNMNKIAKQFADSAEANIAAAKFASARGGTGKAVVRIKKK